MGTRLYHSCHVYPQPLHMLLGEQPAADYK